MYVPGMLRLSPFFQGPTDSGQGGWTASRFAQAIGEGPLTMAIRAPIPLETNLRVVSTPSEPGPSATDWRLVDPDDRAILEARSWEPDFADTAPVTIEEAVAARGRFPVPVGEHPVPFCFSCGLGEEHMRVHAGPLTPAAGAAGRFACDWSVPPWTANHERGAESALWAAMDCCAAFYVGWSAERRTSFTVQYAAEVLAPLDPTATYALVSGAFDGNQEWDGRKRQASAAAFDAEGNCVARARSFWVSVADD